LHPFQTPLLLKKIKNAIPIFYLKEQRIGGEGAEPPRITRTGRGLKGAAAPFRKWNVVNGGERGEPEKIEILLKKERGDTYQTNRANETKRILKRWIRL